MNLTASYHSTDTAAVATVTRSSFKVSDVRLKPWERGVYIINKRPINVHKITAQKTLSFIRLLKDVRKES
jgi:hypothetical protein